MADTVFPVSVQTVIFPELVEALAQAPAAIQTDLNRFISVFKASPLDPPYGVKDTGSGLFRVYELNSAWCVVAAYPAQGLAVLAFAGWTRSALEWINTHEIAPSSPETAGGFFCLKETRAAEDAEEETKPGLFAEVPDDALAGIGLQPEFLGAVRAVTEKDQLEALQNQLPAETFQALTWFTEGASWSAVKRDFSKHHRQAESQMGKMRLYLNPEQEKIVRGPWCHAVLVQGGAGTGKSVVAMHRAKHLAELPDWKESDRLLFVTQTRNLAVDIEEQLQRLVCTDRIKQIEVTNLDGWVTAFLRRNGYKPSLVYPRNAAYQALWKQTMAHLPADFPENVVREEFENNVLSNNIRMLRSYLKSDAESRFSEEEKTKIWPFFEQFRRELFARGKVAAPDAYYTAIGLLKEGSEYENAPYRAVIADEIQDFGPEALKLLRVLCPDHDEADDRTEGDLFLVGDIRERIYGREVSFRSCGINIKGERTLKLSVSYRTTAEISSAANFVLSGGAEPGDEPSPTRHGKRPDLYVGREFDDEVSWIVRQIHGLMETERNMPLSSIVIAARTDSLLDDYQNALSHRGLKTLQISRNIPDDPNAAGVRSATLHRLKGLEFRAVFIVGADDGNIPDIVTLNRSATEKEREEAMQAERSLFHVAATRALDRLFVSCSDTPGEFLEELLEFQKKTD